MNKFRTKLGRSYAGAAESFAQYWRLYGGICALLTSPYLHLSVVLSLIMFKIWSAPGWWDTVLNVLPNVLGFSLGGYAIWLAIGDERFRAILAGGNDRSDTSPFLKINAAFVHFIVMQFLALGVALLAKGFAPHDQLGFFGCLLGWFGYLLFLYALLSALAATMHIFKVATWYDRFLGQERTKQDRPK